MCLCVCMDMHTHMLTYGIHTHKYMQDVSGVKEYLAHVRGSGKYDSQTIMSTLEYRDDTPDALEVSCFL